MFRGKDSLNRIKLSRLVQELLNFGVFGFLWLLGWRGGWMGVGVVGGAPHTCAHAHMHTHTHACLVNVVISCKWLPPLDLRKSQGFPMMSCAHACMHMCVHVGGVHPLMTQNPTTQGGPLESFKIQ